MNSSTHTSVTPVRLQNPAAQTVAQLFTVPHDKKRKREEMAKAAAEQAASPAADDDGRQPPNPHFPVSHYVLSHKVGGGKAQ